MRNGVLLLALVCSAVQADQSKEPASEKIHRTSNFEVRAPTEKIARQVGEVAERHRKEIARRWLGEPLPDWPTRCPLQVKITYNGRSGASTFTFDRGKLLSQSVEVEGTLGAILDSVLPHEITHIVLAHHFRTAVPRWADEGASVLSENASERLRHQALIRQVRKMPDRAIPLKRLLRMNEYPSDVMALYAQGASVTRFLVGRKEGRKTFLAFVKDGLAGDWDRAVRTHYGYKNVSELENAWLKSLHEEAEAVEPP